MFAYIPPTYLPLFLRAAVLAPRRSYRLLQRAVAEREKQTQVWDRLVRVQFVTRDAVRRKPSGVGFCSRLSRNLSRFGA